MGSEQPLSGDPTVLVDANIFFAIGQPSNPRYRLFRRAVTNAGVVCTLPRRVIGELGGAETNRVRSAIDEGWAEIIDPPPPTDNDAVRASDTAKRTIANETGQAEHEVEKADTILAGLAVQHVRDRTTSHVVVLTDDKPAKKGIEKAVRATGYTDAIAVFGVADVIGDDPGGAMRLI